MRKDRLSALIVAIALMTTLATPALAADTASVSPVSGLERVAAFIDGLVKKVQGAACFVGCRSSAAATKTTRPAESPGSRTDDGLTIADGGPPAGMMVGADALGLQ